MWRSNDEWRYGALPPVRRDLDLGEIYRADDCVYHGRYPTDDLSETRSPMPAVKKRYDWEVPPESEMVDWRLLGRANDRLYPAPLVVQPPNQRAYTIGSSSVGHRPLPGTLYRAPKSEQEVEEGIAYQYEVWQDEGQRKRKRRTTISAHQNRAHHLDVLPYEDQRIESHEIRVMPRKGLNWCYDLEKVSPEHSSLKGMMKKQQTYTTIAYELR